MSFDHIIGNDSVKSLLTHAICNNNILHSYMFVGPDGIGKSLFAKEFAKIILCNQHDTLQNPCHSCDSCIYFSSQNHPDFMFIQAEDGKTIKIEQIRYFQEKIAEKPIVSQKKVYIINDSDTMTKEAQNCLLKTLEEPPEYAIIILILSNESKLLNTIKSRCTKIAFQPLNNNMISQYFSMQHIDFKLSDNVLKLCNGSIGKAIELQDESTAYESIDNIIQSISNKDIIDIWNNSNILYQLKDMIQNLLAYMNILFMDQLKFTNDIKYINCIKIVEQTKRKLDSNANYDMCIDSLLLKIWEEFHENDSWN